MSMNWNPLFAAIVAKPESWRYSVDIESVGARHSEARVWFREGDRSKGGIGHVTGPTDFVIAALTAAVEKHVATPWRDSQ